jgi:hypothetical protein
MGAWCRLPKSALPRRDPEQEDTSEDAPHLLNRSARTSPKIIKSKTGLAEFNIRESPFRVALASDFKLLRLRQSVSSGGETGQERVKC